MKIDFKGWKKYTSDKHSTTFINPQGHKLTVAHNSISPQMKDKLSKLPHIEQKMADGGKVQPSPSPKPKQESEDDYQVGEEGSIGNKITKSVQKLFTPNTQHYAEGSPETVQPVQDQPSAASQLGAAVGSAIKHAVGDSVDAFKNVATPVVEAGKGLIKGVLPEQEAEAAPQPEAPKPDPQLAQAQQDLTAASAPSQPQESPQVEPQLESQEQQSQVPGPAEALQQGMQANKDIGNAESAQLKNQERLQQNAASQEQALQYETQQKLKDMEDELVQAKNAFADQKIDPNQYWNNHSKVMAGIGLILGGIGGGILHQENPALKFLNQEIERNVDAQKAELGKKNNLMHFYLQKYHDIETAANMTRLTNATILGHQLEAEAARSGSKVAMARAQLANSQLMAQYAPMLQQTATKNALMSMNQGNAQKSGIDPAVFVPQVVPKEHQKEVFGEIKRAQDTRKEAQDILKDYDSIAAQFKKAGGLGRIGAAIHEPRELSTLHAKLGTTVGDLEGSVRQAAMDNVKGSFTPLKTDTDADLAKRRQGLEEYLQSKMSAPTAKAFGIDLDRFQSTSPQPVSASSPQTMTHKGHQYQKVEGGWKLIK